MAPDNEMLHGEHFKASWYIKNRVIYSSTWNKITAQDLEGLYKAINHLAAQGTAPVYYIADACQVLGSASSPGEYRKAIGRFHENIKMVFVVSQSSIVRFFMTILNPFMQGDFRAYEKVEDALDFLKAIEPSFSDITPEMSLE